MSIYSRALFESLRANISELEKPENTQGSSYHRGYNAAIGDVLKLLADYDDDEN